MNNVSNAQRMTVSEWRKLHKLPALSLSDDTSAPPLPDAVPPPKYETARHIVDRLLAQGPMRDIPRVTQLCREQMAAMAELNLLESPQLYDGPIVYMKDSKFTRISMRNFGDYVLLSQSPQFTCVAHPMLSCGFVFKNSDIAENPSLGLFPVMSVELRDSSIKGYKQAHRLRIRQAYANRGVATEWYFDYVRKIGGIVSDFDHLEGGMRLWRSFVRSAAGNGLKISLVDTASGQWTAVDAGTPDSDIWSVDTSKRKLVLVLERNGI